MDVNEQITASALETLRELETRQNPYAIEWLRKFEAEPGNGLYLAGEMRIQLLAARAKLGENFALDEVLHEMFGD